MKQVQAHIRTTRSPQEVYAYLVDFGRHPEWRFDVLASRLVDGETGRVGARYHQTVRQGGRERESNVELTEAEPGRRVAFRTLDEGPVTVRGTYSIEADGGGSAVTNDVVVETHGVARLFEPLMGSQLRRTAARYEEALAEQLR